MTLGLGSTNLVVMRLDQWLGQERGRGRMLAGFLGVTRSRVSQMLKDGVPKKFIRKVSRFTEGEVSIDEMVPPEDQTSERAS